MEPSQSREFGDWVAGNIVPILTITTLLGVFNAGLAAVDGRVAKDRNVAELSQQLDKVSQRLKLKIQEDSITNMQGRIWNLEVRIREAKGSDRDERIVREGRGTSRRPGPGWRTAGPATAATDHRDRSHPSNSGNRSGASHWRHPGSPLNVSHPQDRQRSAGAPPVLGPGLSQGLDLMFTVCFARGSAVEERRRDAREQPSSDQFVTTALADGLQVRAQVLDRSTHGLRLLFRPGVNLHPGMAIAVRDDHSEGPASARVQWCRHKHRFTIAGIRAFRDQPVAPGLSTATQLA